MENGKNANGDDWQEELYLKIRSIKEMCLPHLSEWYQTTVHKLHYQESLPLQQRSDQFEKLKEHKTNLERMIQFLSVPKTQIVPALKHKVACYEKHITDTLMMHMPMQLLQSQTIHGMQQNASSSKPVLSLEPSQGSESNNGNGSDWQELAYQKINSMKELYLPELNEIYQRVAIKVHHHDIIPQQQRSDEFEKLIQLKTMLERMMQFLSVQKSNILPTVKDKLDLCENQIIGFLNMNRPRDTVQQLQLSQSQTIQDQFHDNQTNPQMKSMSMQVSGPRAQESSLQYMQNSVLSSLPGVSAPQQNIPSSIPASSLESGQGNALNNGRQVFAIGSMRQSTSQRVNNGSASAQSGLWTLHPNVNQTHLSSILPQHQQQQDQLMLLKRKLQYRQMQKEEVLQLLQQQQMPQQMTQQLIQQLQYRQMQQQQLQQQINQLQQDLQARQQDLQMRQQFQQHQMQQLQQQNMPSSILASNVESGQGNALNNTNGGDWQEEIFQRIKSMKEMYLADLNELYQRVVATVQQQNSLLRQERSDNFEKQKEFKRVLEHIIRFLSIVSKSNISPASKEKLDCIEMQIIRYVNAHRSMEQGN